MSAAPDVDAIVTALTESPVYVVPGAERAPTDDQVADLLAQVMASPTDVFVIVVPGSSGDGDALLADIIEQVGREGTYAIIAGDEFRADSSELPAGQAGDIATAAFDEHRSEGSFAVLTDFVDRIETAVAERTSSGSDSGSGTETGSETATPPPATTSDDEGGVSSAGVLLVGAGVLGVGAYLWRRGKRKKAEALALARREEADRQMLRAELSVLADDVVRLEPEVQLHPDAQSDFDAAVNRYRAADSALQYADQPLDLVRVERVLDEARYSMDRVRARLAGRALPEPPPTLQRPGRHGEPAIALDERAQPAYVGYQGGYYDNGWYGGGAGSGLFTGMLLGSMLGGPGWGWGYGGYGGNDTTIINNDYGGDGGSDFGGGDFGGGDFGGGDFGGGDFGGGDF